MQCKRQCPKEDVGQESTSMGVAVVSRPPVTRHLHQRLKEAQYLRWAKSWSAPLKQKILLEGGNIID